MRRVAVVVSLLAACGGAPAPPPRAGVVVVDLGVQTNPQSAVLPAHSLWSGRYECAQGVTALVLTLDVDSLGQAQAVFDFGATPENPTVPTGRYLLLGNVRTDGAITLVPDRWIMQPPGYVMVGLTGTIEASARSMRGRIENTSCTVFALDRVQ
jgi:hypothetical protein